MTIEEKLEVELKIITSDVYFNEFFKTQNIEDYFKKYNLHISKIFDQFLKEKYPHLLSLYTSVGLFYLNSQFESHYFLKPFIIRYKEILDYQLLLNEFDHFVKNNKSDISTIVLLKGVNLEVAKKIDNLNLTPLFDLIAKKKENGGYSLELNKSIINRISYRSLQEIHKENLPSDIYKHTNFALIIPYTDNNDVFFLKSDHKSGEKADRKIFNSEIKTDELIEIINLVTNNFVSELAAYEDNTHPLAPIFEGQTSRHTRGSKKHWGEWNETLDLGKLEKSLVIYADFKIRNCIIDKPKSFFDLIRLAMRRFFLAKLEDNQQDKLINFCICLEALLTNEGNSQEISLKFSLNGAWFLADKREKEKTWKFLHEIYKMRSNIVHGGNPKKLHEIDFKELQAITAEVILKYLTLDKIPDFDKMRLGL